MDKNQKILVAVVGVVLVSVLGFGMKMLFSSDVEENTDSLANTIHFETPKISENNIKTESKKELYDRESEKNYTSKYDTIANSLSFVGDEKKEPESELNLASDSEDSDSNDEDLQLLKDLQEALNNPAMQAENQPVNYNYKPDNYGKTQQNYYQQNPYQGQTQTTVIKKEEEEVKKPKPKIPKKGSFFFGAASSAKKKKALGTDLIPAETIDQGLYQNGATIAIRTKKPIHIASRGKTIPKGAVLYGVVSMGGQRLSIAVNKYKRDNTLYSVNLQVYDYDGLEGIHLNSRTAFGIPARVSEDVYEAAIETYRNPPNGFGAQQQREPLGRVAALSTAKEISKELFKRRRVFVPRKYHLWLTLKFDD